MNKSYAEFSTFIALHRIDAYPWLQPLEVAQMYFLPIAQSLKLGIPGFLVAGRTKVRPSIFVQGNEALEVLHGKKNSLSWNPKQPV